MTSRRISCRRRDCGGAAGGGGHPRPRSRPGNLTELIAAAKAEPGKMSYASAGSGTSHHLAGELFKAMAGVDILHVPYKGAGPALQDLIGGQVDMMFDGLGSSAGHIAGGRIKPLAVASKARAPGRWATSRPRQNRACRLRGLDLVCAVGAEGYAQADPRQDAGRGERRAGQRSAQGSVVATGGDYRCDDAGEMGAFVASEVTRWGKVAKDGNIKVE
jgi:hypothetical protein